MPHPRLRLALQTCCQSRETCRPASFVSLSFGSESLLEVYIPSHLNIGYVQQGGGVQNGFGVWGVTIIRETQQGTLRTTTHSHEIQIPARRKRQSHERDGTALYIPGAPASFNKASILPKSTKLDWSLKQGFHVNSVRQKAKAARTIKISATVFTFRHDFIECHTWKPDL